MRSEHWLERKRKAGDLFVSHLLASPAQPHVAKILLHGSVAEGVARPESDVDVLVFQTGAPEVVDRACDEVSFQKSKILPVDLSRRLRQGLRYRNLARYEYSAMIDVQEAKLNIGLANKLLTFLEAEK